MKYDKIPCRGLQSLTTKNWAYMSNYDRWDFPIPPWVARKLDQKFIMVGKEIPNDHWDEIVDFPIQKMFRTGLYCATVYFVGRIGTSDEKTGRLLRWNYRHIAESSIIKLHKKEHNSCLGVPQDWLFSAKVIELIGYDGITKEYPRIPSRGAAGLLALVRPFTLVAPLLIGVFGGLISAHYNSVPATFLIVIAGIVLACFQAIGQIVNQLSDVEIDRINKPYRPLVSGTVSRKTAWYIALSLAGTGIFLAFLVNERFMLLSMVTLFFAVTYSLEPFRVKMFNEWVALFWMAFSRGFMPFLVTWSIYGKILDSAVPWILGVFAFLWVIAFQSTKDFNDISGDSQFQVPTLPVKYGINTSYKMMATLATLPFFYALLVEQYFLLVLVPVAAIALIFLKKDVKSERFENNTAWMCFYLGLGLIYIAKYAELLFF